ncbi:GNAT family N-acetyltransferase [Amnibacterium endophyticum]|uniref:GNAT family N-acetyltransferase n=1 Tax=Amnibacterium endophyticum TaxID=2109337 RepID=A0ABW4LK23_9MICO
MAIPQPTERLRFREMGPTDLGEMAALLGDPLVMTFYPAPMTRDQAAGWITWNQDNYRRYGFGLWVLETHDGSFVGDCGITWQRVNGQPRLEVGYHVRADLQGRRFATEAAMAARDFARDMVRAEELIAITHPQNAASQRVAEKLGMRLLENDLGEDGVVHWVHGMRLHSA